MDDYTASAPRPRTLHNNNNGLLTYVDVVIASE